MWQAVDLRELRTFLVLAEELHFGRTADRVGLTQSRVSQNLRNLERKLGASLVRRTSRRVELTSDGELFRAELTQALAGLDQVLESGQARGQQLTDPVRLGGTTAASVGPFLRTVIDRYTAHHPESSVEFVGLPFRDRFGPLRRGEVDVMVTGLPLDQPDLDNGPVISIDTRLLAMSRRHPLAALDDVPVEALGDYPVGHLDVAIPPELLEELVPTRTPGGRPIERYSRAFHEPSELILAIAEGTIVQPVASAFPEGYAHPEVIYRPIRGLRPSRTVLAWRRGDRQPSLQAFLEAMHAVLREKASDAT